MMDNRQIEIPSEDFATLYKVIHALYIYHKNSPPPEEATT